jgi:hypothetical protein
MFIPRRKTEARRSRFPGLDIDNVDIVQSNLMSANYVRCALREDLTPY